MSGKKKKDNRSDWVAVESEFSKSNDANKIEKPKSAFQQFSKQYFNSIREELQVTNEGGTFDMGAVQRELSIRWQNTSLEEKTEFNRLAAMDKARYADECRKRDEDFEQERKKRREERNSIVEGKRERKTTFNPEFIRKPRLQNELSEEQKEAKRIRDEIRKQEKEERQELKDEEARQKEELAERKAAAASARLRFLLNQSDIYEHFGSTKKMAANNQRSASKKKGSKGQNKGNSRDLSSPRKRLTEHEEDETLLKDEDAGGEDMPTRLTVQPSVIKHGKLRDYQLEGLNWMISIAERGINGILADEMGLGKTLQTISALAYQLEFKKISGPHLIIVPKSTLSNWLNEFKRWCPSFRCIKFHGNKMERDRVVREDLCPGLPDDKRRFDVCLTSFEMAIKEKGSLSRYAWRYLVIDEAHRIKNEASQFSVTVRMFETQYRLLITGTPLQNNLHELWALLNFLLPDIFSSADQFDDWFNLDIDDSDAKQELISQLHKILRPFMLRRLKSDVEKSLPPKKETLLFVGMSKMQKNLYKSLLLRDMEAVTGSSASRTALLNVMMQLRKCCGHPYLFEGQEDRTLDPMGSHLIDNCGKLVLLDKLIKKLKERGSRVLVFSQMTRVLDILEDFCRIREYKYCRIDGQTTYEEREESIDAFNAENSEKFLFLLSTRAGGLGINLYTADIVILYDSDWNPQADLQAQDRAHRIGQKKSVYVYRLITSDSVEEKVVERAQQKLKLDAMVVQQGRLQEKNKQLSKDDVVEMIRFGADKVFRSTEDEITDADIDAILAEGEVRTKEMMDKLQEHDKGDMLDFKLDGGVSIQQHEGIDYSDKQARAAELKRLAEAEKHAQIMEGIGKRERKPITTYNESNFYRQHDKRKKKLHRALRLPKMDEWQFYDRRRLLEIYDIEYAEWKRLKGNDDLIRSMTHFCSDSILAEKQRLLGEAFSDWNKNNFNSFCKLLGRYGRHDIASVARELEKPEEEVRAYSNVFWKRGTELSDWDKIRKNIEKGEEKLLEIQKLQQETAKKIDRYVNPKETMTFSYQGKQGKAYVEEEDRYLLCLAHEHGYGSWEKVKQDINRSGRFLFDYYLRSRTATEIGRRCDTLMRMCEKENQDFAQREAKDREARKKLEAERESVSKRIVTLKTEIGVSKATLDEIVNAEVARIRREKEKKKQMKELRRSVANGNSSDLPVPKAIGETLMNELKSQIARMKNADVDTIARAFATVHTSVSIVHARHVIMYICKREKKDGELSWKVDPARVSKCVRLMKKRKKCTEESPNGKSSSSKKQRLPRSPWSPSASRQDNSLVSNSRKRYQSDDEALEPPKKKKTAYILFCLAERKAVRKTLGGVPLTEVMNELTTRWKALTREERESWTLDEAEDAKRFDREWAEYERRKQAIAEKKRKLTDEPFEAPAPSPDDDSSSVPIVTTVESSEMPASTGDILSTQSSN